MSQARAIVVDTSRDSSARPQPAPTDATRPFALCEVLAGLDAARAPWAELEACAIATPYQNFAFLQAWLATIGRARRVSPLIIVARDESGQVNALLPFVATRVGPFHVAEFLGGKDANFKMGLFRPGLALEDGALVDLLRRAAAIASPRLAGFLFLDQPMDWQGVANPMSAIGGEPSPSFGYRSALGGDFPAWLNTHYSRAAHKKLRKKAQRLDAIGPVSHCIARDAESARQMLAAHVAQKDARMRELGLSRSWDRELTLEFLTQASDAAALELHALSCGDRLVATFGGLARGDRLCGMFISHDSDPQFARCSPGELLLNAIVANLIERRFATLDLGVGEARYKAHCCEAEEPLFDSFLAMSFPGRLLGAALRGKQRMKRLVKQSPAMWGLFSRLRRRFG